MAGDFDVDRLIKHIEDGNLVEESDAVTILTKLMEILYSEGNVLEITSPVVICGDIHGQLYDLFELFDHAGPKEDQKFLFMGDYVDRGYYSIETFCYLAALKVKRPDQVYLLRGNHECRQVNQMYGFFNECQFRFGHGGIWSLCNEVFDLLPMAALIDNRVFSIHGGLSPDIPLIECISLINRNDELPASGPLCDICWSDPDSIQGWRLNQRGAGYLFGSAPVNEFCQNNGLDFITRSHQPAMEGFQWFFDNKLVTVWSAPNYMYRSGNRASIMKYHPQTPNPDQTLFDLVRFDARPADRRKVPEELPNQSYFL